MDQGAYTGGVVQDGEEEGLLRLSWEDTQHRGRHHRNRKIQGEREKQETRDSSCPLIMAPTHEGGTCMF